MSSNTDNQRINFASVRNPMPCPDFLEVQLKSFKDFLQLDTPPEKRKNEGLYKVFSENFPHICQHFSIQSNERIFFIFRVSLHNSLADFISYKCPFTKFITQIVTHLHYTKPTQEIYE